MIRLRGVTKRYGEVQVLGPVDLDVPARGVTALVGANGAGKSTLLTIVGRLIEATSGQVHVGGHDLARTPSRELAKVVSILRQENHFITRLTVRELVSFGRFPHSQGRLTRADHDHVDQRHAVAVMKRLRRAADELGKTFVIVIHDVDWWSTGAARPRSCSPRCSATSSAPRSMSAMTASTRLRSTTADAAGVRGRERGSPGEKRTAMAYLLYFEFPTPGGAFGEAAATAYADLAADIAAEDGLVWKVWIENPEAETTGGVYLFADRRSAERYADFHSKRIAAFGFTDVIQRGYEVNETLSLGTHATLTRD